LFNETVINVGKSLARNSRMNYRLYLTTLETASGTGTVAFGDATPATPVIGKLEVTVPHVQ
jgi:hypothetical protein